jgi:hypothetical protein
MTIAWSNLSPVPSLKDKRGSPQPDLVEQRTICYSGSPQLSVRSTPAYYPGMLFAEKSLAKKLN